MKNSTLNLLIANHKLPFIFLIISISNFLIILDARAQVNEQDSLALVALYNSTDGANWTDNTGWLTEPVANWSGVSVDPNTNRVIGIYLFNANLNGSLPVEIGNLTALSNLTIQGNDNLIGAIPFEFWNLSDLQTLNLSYNSLNDSIPAEISQLGNLTSLNLNTNNLSGNLPEEIGLLSRLTTLTLFNNQFEGALPTSISNLLNLENLSIGNNNFTGQLLPLLSSLTNLQILDVAINNFDGEIPLDFYNLVNLNIINLGNNNFSGVLAEEIGSLTNLTRLGLFGNNFEGEIPQNIANLTALTSLNLGSNNFSGEPLPLLITLTNLQYIQLSGNAFEGQIPVNFYNLVNLTGIHLEQCNFSGEITDDILNIAGLQSFWVRGNQLTRIPDFTSLTNFSSLFVHNNNLDFADLEPNFSLFSSTNDYSPMNPIGLPTDTLINEGDSFSIAYNVGGQNNNYQWYRNNQPITGATTNILTIPNADTGSGGQYYLSVTNSLVTGLEIRSEITTVTVDINFSTTIESDSLALVDLYNATSGDNWTNDQNWLSTPLNEWFGITLTNGRVSSVNLSNNNLAGTIPSSIANMEALSSLNLGGNSINSPIPVEFLNLRLLTTFQVNNNNLTELPNFSTMESLGFLDVRNNDLWFDDLLPLTAIVNFSYAPQRKSNSSFVPGEDINRLLGESLNLTSTNQDASLNYQWYKWNWPLTGENNAGYTIPVIEGKHQGSYAAGLRHPDLPNLTLFEYRYFLDISCDDYENTSLNAFQYTSYTINGAFGMYGQNDSVTISYRGNNGNIAMFEISDYTASFYANVGGPAAVSTTLFLECGGIQMAQRDAGYGADNTLEGYYDVEGDSLVLTWYNNFNNFVETTVFKPKPFGGVTEQDSLALVDIYNATNGDSWNNNGNWLSTTVDRWLGVNVEGDRVSKISLPSNNLDGDLLSSLGNLSGLTEIRLPNNEIGSLPVETGNLVNLTFLELSNNSISELPDISNITTLQYLNVTSNHLQFEDLLPYIGLANFNYAPQLPIGEIQEEFLNIGESITLNTSIKDNGEANYQWILNGDSIANETGSEISINSFSTANAGVYLLQAKHPQLPQLILRSAGVFLKIGGGKTNWYVDNRPGTVADFRDVNQAFAATKAGDTLYISGSSEPYESLFLTSPRTILGPGYFLEENTESQYNTEGASLSIGVSALADGSKIYGLNLHTLQTNNQASSLSDTLQNVIIEGNKINTLSMNDKHNEIDIIRNFIDILQFASTPLDNPRSYDNILINNNIIGTIQTLFDVINTSKNGLSNVAVNNNTIREVSDDINDLEFNNNIIGYQGGNNAYSNTLAFDESLFTNNSGTLSIDNDFIPNDAGLAQGAFAGDSPYILSGLPPVPSIYNIEIGPRLSAKLNIKSNNENNITGIRYLYRRNNQSSAPFNVNGFNPASDLEVEFLPNRSAIEPNLTYDLVFQALDGTGKRSHRTYIPYEAIAANLSGSVVDIENINVNEGHVRLFAINPFANKYDTAAVQALNGSNTFNFENLILGDYIILADPDEGQYPNLIPTYLGNTLDWQVADTLFLQENRSGITIEVEKEPDPLTEPGSEISGFIEEQFEEADSSLRVLPARRVSGVGVSVRTLVGSSRLETSLRLIENNYELVAYVQTDENGEFAFPNLPTGDYRIRFEYPGVETDETSDIDFNLSGEQGEVVSVAALVQDGLIKVTETGRVLANKPDQPITFSFFPNPVKNEINLKLENALNANELIIFDMKGIVHKKILLLNGQTKIDLHDLASGSYIIRLQDTKGNYFMSKMIKN